MPIGPAKMPLIDHLGELRMRLVRIAIVLFVALCVFYMATPTIGQLLLLPIKDYLPTDAQGLAVLNSFDPWEAFSVRLRLACWASVVACMPLILWQILAFFLPALKPKERRWFIPTFFMGVVLFIGGTVFCYFFILPPAFQWLTGQVLGLGTIAPRLASYIDMIIKFEVGFGFAFELPLIVFYLVIFGIIPYRKLRKLWRYIYIALMVIAAMITPDASPVTMLLMFAALVALYEIALLFARIVLRKRIKRKQDAELREEEEQLEWEQQKEALRKRFFDFEEDEEQLLDDSDKKQLVDGINDKQLMEGASKNQSVNDISEEWVESIGKDHPIEETKAE